MRADIDELDRHVRLLDAHARSRATHSRRISLERRRLGGQPGAEHLDVDHRRSDAADRRARPVSARTGASRWECSS